MYQILRRITGCYSVGGLAGIVFLLSYILMAGLSVSSMRAVIMFLFRVGADMCGRKYDSPTALSVAAVVVLFWRPLYLYDGGFWLSFGAVFAVIIILPVFKECVFQSFWVSLSINLMLLPIICFYFYEFPLYSIVLNLAVIPLMSILMFLGISGSFFCLFIYPLGEIFLLCCKLILWLYEILCVFFIDFPLAGIITGVPSVWKMSLYYVMLLVVVLLCQWKQKYWSGIVFMFFGLGLLYLNPVTEKDLKITVLDVGQGDGIFIESPEGMTVLVDGGSSDIEQLEKYRMEPFLKSQGIGKLDYVFVTHGDGDHTSGIEEMIERDKRGVEIGMLIMPEIQVWDDELRTLAKKAIRYGIPVTTIEAGQTIKEGKMTIACLVPLKNGSLESGNEASLVLALSWRNFDILLTGDVEGEGEEALTDVLRKEYGQTKWEVLKVAHHGSKNSTTEEFVEIVQPKYAIVSAGMDNSYGHPHQETIERLENAGSEIITTQESGAIRIITDGEIMWVDEYVEKGERYE